MKFQNIFIILVLVGFAAIGVWAYLKPYQSKLASPVLGISKSRLADNIWFPKEASDSADFQDAPEITASSAFFVETNSGEVLYQKNQKEKVSIASLIKIMTAIVALEYKNMNDIYVVSFQASEMEPDKMFLIPGERLTLKQLLEGIFLISANDASEVIAEETTGSRGEFLGLMNSKASQIGMKDSFFVNPSGLEEDNIKQNSTAYDVLLMSRYLIRKWPEVVDISSQPYVFIEATSEHQDYDMYSGINLLTTYPGVVGLKTGYTHEAGLTLVTVVRRGDKEVIGVLLNSASRRDDAKVLLDYSFKKLGFQV